LAITADLFSYRREIFRKLIHLSSLWMPVAILQFGVKPALAIFGVALSAVLLFEIMRKRRGQMALALNRAFSGVIRPQEYGAFRLTGAPFVLTSGILLCLVFSPIIAATALAIALVGDTAAALIGRRYGWTRIGNKSLEGSIAFFVAGMATLACIAWATQQPSAFITAGAAAAFVASITELYARFLLLDDNLTVPFAAASVMWFFLS
jgi:dolichol kinase